MKSIVRLALILFIVCGLAAGSLAGVAELTREPIAQQAVRETAEALRTVSPQATDFTPTGDGSWDALQGGTKLGEVRAITTKGYGGPIKIVFGLDTEERITGVRVVSQTETPGLGNKVAGDAFLSQFPGKTVADLRLRKDDASAGTIDAVSAATISSRAVTNGLRNAMGGQ